MVSDQVENKLAWAAGFFDGEGCIKVSRQKVNYSKGYRHTLVVHITQKIKSPLVKFQTLFGGKIYPTKKGKFTGYEYLLSNQDAIKLIKSINPFLILKKDEAKVALKHSKAFISSAVFEKVSDEKFKERDILYSKLKTIKDKKYNRK